MGDYSLIPDDPPPRNSCILTLVQIEHSKPWAFFYSAAQKRGYGGGAILHLNQRHSFRMLIGFSRGTNNYTELLAAKHLIYFALEKKTADICNYLGILKSYVIG